MKKEIMEQIEAYEDLINFFSTLASLNKDEELTNLSNKYVSDFKNKISELKSIDKDAEKGTDTKSDDVTEEKDEPDYIKYVNSFFESDYDNVNVRIEFQKLLNQLLSDLNNPNDRLIETWINNYKNFVNDYNLDNDMMYKFMVNEFEKNENGKKYVDRLDNLYNKTKEKTKDDTKSNDDNETIQKKQDDLGEDKTDKSDIVEDDDLEDEKDDIKEDEYNGPLKIVNTKKTQFTRAQKLGLTALAIISISKMVTMTPIAMPILMGFGIYKLAKNFRYRHGKLDKFLEKNGLNISADGNLIDEKGDVITEVRVGREKYKYLKRHLMHMGAMKNKMINFKYIKDKIMSKILNPINEVRQERKQEKEEIKKELDSMDYLTRRSKEKVMKKGLGYR